MNDRLDAWLASKPGPAVRRLVDGLDALFGASFGASSGASSGASAGATDEPVEIRAPRPGAIGHIIARHGEFYVGELGYPAAFEHVVVEAFGEFMTDFSPPRDRIFIAERGERFAGSIAVKGRPDATSQLRFLLVEPEARGLGLGRRLVRSVVDHVRRLGDRRIILDTASDLAAARTLYAAHGFRKTASTDGEPWLPRGVASERWELDL